MANYLVRIVLHGANEWDDYQPLWEAMEERGFEKAVQADDGKLYDLPAGMYAAVNVTSTIAYVRDTAVEAAGTTGFKHKVFVAEYSSWVAKNLDEHHG